jgi:hypothetical protein
MWMKTRLVLEAPATFSVTNVDSDAVIADARMVFRVAGTTA